MACHVVRNNGFPPLCEIPRQTGPPTVLRGEQCAVDSDCKPLVPGYVVDPPQPILRALRDGRGIERSHVKLDSGSSEFDTHPMKNAVSLFGAVQMFATIR